MDIPDRLKEVEESVEYLSTQKELLGQISAQLEQLNQHVFGKEKEIGEHSFNNDNGRSPNRGSHVFHISVLKQKLGEGQLVLSSLPDLNNADKFIPSPQAVMGSRIYKGNQEVLVHWKGLSPVEAS
ncbi:hypothetical protein QYF36_010103 [Acer negundo]|nr:hypothetical protein QYF36_010103 [Acer negundo]